MAEVIYEPHDAEGIIEHMSVGGKWRHIYFLNCGLERRVNVLSQQVRGISLVSALFDPPINGDPVLKRGAGDKVAVIGGGVAGVAAACRAVHGGCEITLFEAEGRTLAKLAESHRYLHPRIYDWPAPNFANRDADLSILNWHAGTAAEVTECLTSQWQLWLDLYRPENGKVTGHLKCAHRCGPISLSQQEAGGYRVQWTGGEDGFKCVILAVGFGKEYAADFNEEGIAAPVNYWSRRPRKLSCAKPEWTLFVSGLGDSSLRDLLNDVVQDDLLELAGNAAGLKRLIAALQTHREKAEQRLAVEKSYLQQPKNEEQRKRNADIAHGVEKFFLAELTPPDLPLHLPHGVEKVRILMQGRHPSYLSPVSFPLNRYLLAGLARQGHLSIEYQSGEGGQKPGDPGASAEKVAGGYRIQWPQMDWHGLGRNPVVDRAYYRHGSRESNSLKIAFPEIYEQVAAKMRDKVIDTGSYLYRKGSGTQSRAARVFYSDLYDSVIQRQLEATFREVPIQGPQSALVDLDEFFLPLFAGRMRLELALRDQLILADMQLLDGRFFLRRWATARPEIALGLEEFTRHVRDRRILLKFRAPDVWATLEKMLLKSAANGLESRRFLLSALGAPARGESLGKRVKDLALQSSSTGSPAGNVRQYINALQHDITGDANAAAACEALVAQAAHWERCAGQNWKCELWNGVAYLPGAFEDPAGLLLGLESKEGKLFAEAVFAEWQRSKVDGDFWQGRENKNPEVRSDYMKIYEWYNRAYHRAIAQQHGATIIETTFVKKFPRYMRPHLQRWRGQALEQSGALTPAHLLALASLPEVDFLHLRDHVHQQAAQSPLAVLEQLEKSVIWRERNGEFLSRCARLNEVDFHSVEPEFRLLCGPVSTTWQVLDEYRIFDSISPAGVQVNLMGSLHNAEQHACSLAEFYAPL